MYALFGVVIGLGSSATADGPGRHDIRSGPGADVQGGRAVPGFGGTATQCPATVAKRITGEGSEKGEELMTPIRTPGANSARREGR